MRADVVMLACEAHRAAIRTAGSAELPGLGLSLFFSSFETASYEDANRPEDFRLEGESQAPPGEQLPMSRPYLWMQFVDAAGRPLSKQMFLGRCAESGFRVRSVLILPVTGDSQPGVTRASYRRKPDLSPGGPAVLAGGLRVRLVFWSVENPHDASGRLIQPASIDIKLLEAGAAFRLPKQPATPTTHRNGQILASLPGRMDLLTRSRREAKTDASRKKGGVRRPRPLSPET